MDAGARRINDIFNGSRVLEIPFFQRAYVWGEEQWERLLEDVETVTLTGRPYFLGSVILKQQQTNTQSSYGDIRTVIDGQQRLTTLSILLKVLCLKTNQMNKFDKRFRLDDGTNVLRHNHNDITAYTYIMNLASEIEIDKKDNVTGAYNYFRDNVNPEKVSFEAVANSILLVVIDLTVDEDEQQIFDTINSLGVRLTTAELLKNFFFGRDDIQQYERYWKELFEKDEETKEYWDMEITTGRLKRSFIDIFFHSYLQIKINDSALSVRTEDKIQFSKVEKLFESYKQFIKEYCGGQKELLLDEIKNYAKSFHTTFDPSVTDAELPAKPGIERINAIIFGLETTTLIPYILFVENNIIDIDVKNELYGFIEAFIMRRIIDRASTKNYNQLFSDRLILNSALSKQDFLDYLQKQDDKANYMPSDSQLEAALKSSVLTNKQAAGVLYFIESGIRDRSRHSTQLLGLSKYSLEHVMPKKWRNNWIMPDTQQQIIDRDRKLLTLGNLTIITQALNASIRDADWNIKKNGRDNASGLKKYAEGIDTFSNFLIVVEWNEAVIDERATFLLEKVCELWDTPSQDTSIDRYFCFGVCENRSWEDALRYGFVSAGGGHWYTRTMLNLRKGDRIWVYVPDKGYVGVGIVKLTAQPARGSVFQIDDREAGFFDLLLTANYHRDLTQDKEEHLVCVDWVKTVALDDAVSNSEFFSNQNTVAHPIADSWHFTVKTLKELWDIDD